MKQTVLEWFIQEFEKEPTKANLDRLNEQAKEMEKQQQCYSEEDLRTAWDSSEQNMRFTFSSSAYKNISFKQWLEEFKKE